MSRDDNPNQNTPKKWDPSAREDLAASHPSPGGRALETSSAQNKKSAGKGSRVLFSSSSVQTADVQGKNVRNSKATRQVKPDTKGKFQGRTLLMGENVPPRNIPLKPRVQSAQDPRYEHYKSGGLETRMAKQSAMSERQVKLKPDFRSTFADKWAFRLIPVDVQVDNPLIDSSAAVKTSLVSPELSGPFRADLLVGVPLQETSATVDRGFVPSEEDTNPAWFAAEEEGGNDPPVHTLSVGQLSRHNVAVLDQLWANEFPGEKAWRRKRDVSKTGADLSSNRDAKRGRGSSGRNSSKSAFTEQKVDPVKQLFQSNLEVERDCLGSFSPDASVKESPAKTGDTERGARESASSTRHVTDSEKAIQNVKESLNASLTEDLEALDNLARERLWEEPAKASVGADEILQSERAGQQTLDFESVGGRQSIGEESSVRVKKWLQERTEEHVPSAVVRSDFTRGLDTAESRCQSEHQDAALYSEPALCSGLHEPVSSTEYDSSERGGTDVPKWEKGVRKTALLLELEAVAQELNILKGNYTNSEKEEGELSDCSDSGVFGSDHTKYTVRSGPGEPNNEEPFKSHQELQRDMEDPWAAADDTAEQEDPLNAPAFVEQFRRLPESGTSRRRRWRTEADLPAAYRPGRFRSSSRSPESSHRTRSRSRSDSRVHHKSRRHGKKRGHREKKKRSSSRCHAR